MKKLERDLPRCAHGTLRSKHGYEIATYTWLPEGDLQPRAVVITVHGLHGWAGFDCMALDEHNMRRKLEGSFTESLLNAGFAVVAYDHPGHGQSSGLEAYVESFDHLRDVLQEMTEDVSEKHTGLPKFLVGMSMGGLTCVMASLADKFVADGIILLSPAVHTPADMFGLYGSFLRSINRPMSWLVPQLKVMDLPLPDDPLLRDAFLSDPLNYTGAMRVRVGAEFIRVYALFDGLHSIFFQNVLVVCGTNDSLVSPQGVRHFFDRIVARTKKLVLHDDMGHEVLHEEGYERVYGQVVDWISDILVQNTRS